MGMSSLDETGLWIEETDSEYRSCTSPGKRCESGGRSSHAIPAKATATTSTEWHD